MTDAPKWIFRNALPDDISFIYSTWLKSYRTGSGLGLASGKHAYFLLYNSIIDQILKRDGVIPTIAADPGEPQVIYGYLVAEPGVVHYIYVKEAFRKFGIASDLYKRCGKPKIITHRTREITPLLEKYALTCNPAFLFQQGD